MEGYQLTDGFVEFGLTRQEALVYLCLYENGIMTGYEVSKETGISRSNVYKALASLVDKGAAYKKEGQAQKYAPVEVEEFCGNKIRHMMQVQKQLEAHMPVARKAQEGYITVAGDRHILDKMMNMLKRADKRVYISMSAKLLSEIEAELKTLLEQKKKVVILTDKLPDLQGATVYITKSRGSQIGMITDSEYVLTGEYGKGAESQCLYSDQKNFVRVFKDSMANEIKLLELSKGESL